MQVIQRASDDSADDAEDLRSLLWHLELQHIRCELREEPRKTEAVASEPREPEAVPALELPTSSDLAVLLGGLRPEGLGTIMRWLSKAESKGLPPPSLFQALSRRRSRGAVGRPTPQGLGTIMRWLSKAESGPAPAVVSLAVEQVVVNRLG